MWTCTQASSSDSQSQEGKTDKEDARERELMKLWEENF